MAKAVPYIVGGIWNTVLITACAFAIGAVLGIPLAWARRSRLLFARAAARAYVEVVRSVPPLVWLFLVFFGLPQKHVRLGPLMSAIVTLGFIAGAYLSEIYRSGLGAIGKGQFEAAAALNVGPLTTVRSLIVPQVLRVIVPMVATYAIGLIKDSALASTIGVADITFRANFEAERTGVGLTVFLIAGALYLLISLPLAAVSRNVGARLSERYSVG